MLARNGQPKGFALDFATDANFNFSVNNVFNYQSPIPANVIPAENDFLLLDGSNFLLLDGTNFLLL
jgi:hypothetical protein